jgi:hypothetical protein
VGTGAATLGDGPVPLSGTLASPGTTLDAARSEFTLGETGTWRIAAGVSVASVTGSPVLTLLRDGDASENRVAIMAPGVTSFEWIRSYPAGTKLQIGITGGVVTLAGECNTYLTAMKLG